MTETAEAGMARINGMVGPTTIVVATLQQRSRRGYVELGTVSVEPARRAVGRLCVKVGEPGQSRTRGDG